MYPPAVHSARGTLSAHVRYHPDDVEGIAEYRRAFITERLAALIERNLAEAPGLNGEQVSRLVSLLQAAQR